LGNNLKKLLIYLLKNTSGMSRTSLVKFVYLFEYYYRNKYGKHFTETQFIRYNYGPFDQNIIDTVSELTNEGIVNVVQGHYMDSTTYVYKLNTQSQYYAYDELTGKERFVADVLISKLKNLTATEIANFSYSTPPMLEIIELEEKIGHRLNRRRLDMTKTGSIYRPTKKRLIAARKRLAQRDKTRGSKEERALYRLELYREFQDLRDQVNKVFVAHEEEYR
jgi:uncharacterized protein YwgA